MPSVLHPVTLMIRRSSAVKIIGPGPFEGSFHLLDSNEARIIIDRIGLFPADESFLNFLDTLQPLQGRFSNVISLYEKDHFGEARFFPIYNGKRCQDQNNQSHRKKKILHSHIHRLTLPLLFLPQKDSHVR